VAAGFGRIPQKDGRSLAMSPSRLILLPLDDRPPTYLFPQRIAGIAGVDLVVPPRSLLGKFLVPGKCEALGQWLSEQSNDADGLLVAVDMLAYGGLVASRSTETSLAQAQARLEVLKQIKQKHPEIQIFAASVIMRISITAANAGVEPYYRDIIRYSELNYRVEIEGREDCRAEYEGLRQKIPAPVLTEYFNARARNHEINRLMMRWFADGILDRLILLQEDASVAGPHLMEQQKLRQLAAELSLSKPLRIYPGADEGTQTLLAAWLNQARDLPVCVRYTSEEAAQNAMPFEDRPLSQSVQNHLAAAGCRLASLEEAACVLWVHTPWTGDQVQHAVSDIRGLLDAGKIAGIADVQAPNGSDNELMVQLVRERILFRLGAYAGWNTAGNTIGTTLAHLCAWVAAGSSDCRGVRLMTQEMFLWERVIDDWGYQRVVREDVEKQLVGMGLDPLNLGEKKIIGEQLVQRDLSNWIRETFTDQDWPADVPETVIRLSWPRTFEVEVRCN
jgi:hypothetical protein